MANETVLPSTLFLTVLLLVGLFFFLRASTKNRTEVRHFPVSTDPESCLNAIQAYLVGRAYRVVKVNPSAQEITFEGLVGASVGLAIFLTLLAVLGLASLGLVLGMLWSPLQGWGLGLVVIAPLAPWFYWQGAQRLETVTINLTESDTTPGRATITITAHRDELIALDAALNFGD